VGRQRVRAFPSRLLGAASIATGDPSATAVLHRDNGNAAQPADEIPAMTSNLHTTSVERPNPRPALNGRGFHAKWFPLLPAADLHGMAEPDRRCS
jgi:hypothetical protein